MDPTDRQHAPQDVRGFFATWLSRADAGDWVGFAELLHPDIELTDPMLSEPARGHVAALQRVQAQYAPFPDGRMELVGEPFVAVEGPELAYQWRFLGTHLRRIDPPGFTPTGRPVEIRGASVLRFQEQRVIAVRLFFDTTAVARQLLAAPPAGGAAERAIALVQRTRAVSSRRARRGDASRASLRD